MTVDLRELARKVGEAAKHSATEHAWIEPDLSLCPGCRAEAAALVELRALREACADAAEPTPGPEPRDFTLHRHGMAIRRTLAVTIRALGDPCAGRAETMSRSAKKDKRGYWNGKRIDVVDTLCFDRSCYALGFDKGSFLPGRGYTSYHRDGDRPVCQTRHLHGCPHPSVCPECRLCALEFVTICPSCHVPVVPLGEPEEAGKAIPDALKRGAKT